MSLNNFSKIEQILRSKNITDDNFFFLQILQRKKDNPDQDRHVYVIDTIFVKDADDLLDKQDRIAEVCYFYNARAYINLNKRSKKKVALETLKLIATNIAAENFDIKNCYTSCCGQYASDPFKTWVVDIDIPNPYPIIDVINTINTLVDETSRAEEQIHIITTKNGIHLITPPFNIELFRRTYPNIDIHKDNPTLLYG